MIVMIVMMVILMIIIVMAINFVMMKMMMMMMMMMMIIIIIIIMAINFVMMTMMMMIIIFIFSVYRELSERKRTNIFNNSVLVLSKCDKIRQGLEHQIADLINFESASNQIRHKILKDYDLKNYPYRYIVGVINKLEGLNDDEMYNGCFVRNSNYDSNDDNNNSNNDNVILDNNIIINNINNYIKFKENFIKIKEHEKNIFLNFKFTDTDGVSTALNSNTQCTTASVFYQMDRISFDMIQKSIENGIISIDKQIDEVELLIKSKLAPPLSFYDNDGDNDTTTTTNNNNNNNNNSYYYTSSNSNLHHPYYHPDDGSTSVLSNRRIVFLEGLYETINNLLIDRFIEFSNIHRDKELFNIQEWPDFELGKKI